VGNFESGSVEKKEGDTITFLKKVFSEKGPGSSYKNKKGVSDQRKRMMRLKVAGGSSCPCTLQTVKKFEEEKNFGGDPDSGGETENGLWKKGKERASKGTDCLDMTSERKRF